LTNRPILEVHGLEVNYGPIKAVKGISLDLAEGKITTLVGANGAGKTSTLLALSGLVKKAGGKVTLKGQDLSGLSPHRIVESGLVQVAEGRATLTTLTVKENLLLGAYTRSGGDDIAKDLESVYELFPRLRDRASGYAGNLSGGEQQMLAIGRAMMAKPKVLLLDEPSMGLAPIVVQDIFKTLRYINAQGVTMLLVEQNVRQALRIADYAYVLETGSVVLEGPGRTLLLDRQIQKSYLGG
jgi:branched-chain amino acid transport system ATP-binding protein